MLCCALRWVAEIGRRLRTAVSVASCHVMVEIQGLRALLMDAGVSLTVRSLLTGRGLRKGHQGCRFIFLWVVLRPYSDFGPQ